MEHLYAHTFSMQAGHLSIYPIAAGSMNPT
jgi:hypothetical protein